VASENRADATRGPETRQRRAAEHRRQEKVKNCKNAELTGDFLSLGGNA